MAPQKLDIQFCTGGLPFDGDTIKHKSLGGSESAALYMARALAARGHRVKHFTNIDREATIDGVSYLPLKIWGPFSQDAHHDVAIVQRNPAAMAHPINAKLSILWQHDLALRRGADVMRATKWRTDKTFLLSQFHVDQYKQVVGMEDHEVYQTRNGFDFSRKPKHAGYTERDRNLYLYAARPERGLQHVLQTVFPAILKMNPDARLAVCTYDNQIPELGGFYQHIEQLMSGLPVTKLGALTKDKLYSWMSSAIAYLYPTPGLAPYHEFREISCIAAIEAQACGLPFIHTGEGALSETLPSGLVTNCAVNDMASIAVALANNPAEWSNVQAVQYEHVQPYDWNTIAAEWEDKFLEWIDERNNSRARLAQWFYRRSEIEGVKACIEDARVKGEVSPILDRLERDVAEHYWFMRSEADLADHYQNMGEGIIADLSSRKEVFTLDSVKNNPEPRFQIMAQVLKEHGVQTMLDAGCGHGWSSLFFAANLGIKVVGYDVDRNAVKWATQLREQIDPNLPAHFFSEWEKASYFTAKAHGGALDAVICSEVLEHVIDPNKFIEQAEKFVKPGGLVMCTVPFGPWEFDGPNWHGQGRTHIREISQHCIYEMFGHKTDFKCGAVRTAHHATLGDPLGFYLFSWKADGQPTRARDMARMLRLQRPTETLSVNMIAGPNVEKTIRWALDSVKSIADEIVIADTGMSATALLACAEYGAKVIPAPSPLEAGFSVPRNIALDHSSGDWILWLDTDERVMQPELVRQYLRKNQANGYALRQIHASADDNIGHDTPVRMFRRDSGCRFIGLVHEHPETGLNKGPGNVCIIGGYPAVWHIGYENNQTRGQRFIRNRPLVIRDRQENPDRVLGIFLDARDNILMMQEYAARNNGQPTPQSVEHARNVLTLSEQFMKADVPLMGISVDAFKAQALAHLGMGVDVAFELRVNRDGVGDPGPFNHRFADEDDLRSFIDRTIKAKMEKLNGPYW